jgi:Glycine-zipper domain
MKHLSNGLANGLAVVSALAVVACAQNPVIYPNQRARAVGQAQIDADVAECKQLADEVAKQGANRAAGTAKDVAVGGTVGAAGGAVGGAIYGNAGTGAAAGAATGAATSFLWRLIRPRPPSPAYTGTVNHCLHDKGYEVSGWQ